MQQREQHIIFRLGNGASDARWQQRAHGARATSTRLRRRTPNHLESVSQDRSLVRQEAQHFRDRYERSESAAQFPKADVQTLTHQLNESRETSEYLHNLNARFPETGR